MIEPSVCCCIVPSTVIQLVTHSKLRSCCRTTHFHSPASECFISWISSVFTCRFQNVRSQCFSFYWYIMLPSVFAVTCIKRHRTSVGSEENHMGIYSQGTKQETCWEGLCCTRTCVVSFVISCSAIYWNRSFKHMHHQKRVLYFVCNVNRNTPPHHSLSYSWKEKNTCIIHVTVFLIKLLLTCQKGYDQLAICEPFENNGVAHGRRWKLVSFSWQTSKCVIILTYFGIMCLNSLEGAELTITYM